MFKVVCNFDVFATKSPEWGGLWHLFFLQNGDGDEEGRKEGRI